MSNAHRSFLRGGVLGGGVIAALVLLGSFYSVVAEAVQRSQASHAPVVAVALAQR